MNFKEKICLVTGGVSGIGKEIVTALLENGVKHITVVDINEKLGNELVEVLGKKYGQSKLSFSKTDVTNAKELEGTYQNIINTFGLLDIVVNNAGIAREEDYELMISINLTSVIRSTNMAIKYMTKTPVKSEIDCPTILNVSSASAFLDFALLPEYSATKAGVISFVRGKATADLLGKKGIRIVCLCPGYTPGTNLFQTFSEEYKKNEAELLKNEKRQTPDVVARGAIEMLKKAKTGAIWVVDGGDLFNVKSQYLQTCTELLQGNI